MRKRKDCVRDSVYIAILRWKDGKSPYSKDNSVGPLFTHRDDTGTTFAFDTAAEAEADGLLEAKCSPSSEYVGVIHVRNWVDVGFLPGRGA